MIPEETRKEIEKSAQYINMSVEEALAKFEEICSENGLSVDDPIAKGLWRNFVANARRNANANNDSNNSNDSYYKNAFGFFVSLDAPRDMMSWNRARAKEEFLRDSDNALENGIVAVANENALGKWTVSRYHNNEYREKVLASLPDGAETLEDGRVFIPLDNTVTYMNGGKNNNYGKPLPKEQMRRTGVFYGSLGQGEMKPYFFSYKNQGGVDFAPNTFEWVHFLCVASDDGLNLYGAKDLTSSSLTLNADMNPENELYRDMSDFEFEKALQGNFDSHLTPLVELDRAHLERQGLPSKERYIITDGTVTNMNMTPASNGNRIINISDLNTEMDFDNDGLGITTCWIPEHLTLDFGIGSSVIIVGRTSQRTTDEGVEPVTINVSGLLCVERKGSAVEVSQPMEEDFDWF
jgi:hypothetical protein|tara:strand:- start:1090 stop:2313 length:1224 start_codon:yes stop_codon:yes gene_type:complete